MNILLLTIEKFRGEQKILSNNENINLFSISEKWLNIFYKIFYGNFKIDEALKKAYSNNPPEWYVKRQKNYQDFLERIFSRLNQKYNFDFFVSADFRYYSNVDWGRAAEKKNIKWIIFYRENLFACKDMYDIVKNRHKKWDKFPGTKILTHNQVSKKMLLESNFIKNSSQIKVLGCMRMDSLHKKNKYYNKSESENIITLFSFAPKNKRYPLSVFIKTHQTLVLFAKRNPDVKIIIKPKVEIVKKTDWNFYFEKSLKELSINIKKINNIKIIPNEDAQNLILKSKFTIGLNSSTVLESAIINIPVIVPYFSELRTKEYEDKIYFKEFLDCFDTPSTSQEFLKVMEMRLKEKYKITKYVKEKRVKLFESYMGKFDQKITDRYIKELRLLKNAY